MSPFLVATLAAVPLAFGLRASVRWLLFRDRKPERLEDLFKQFQFNNPIDFQAFATLISLVGACYHIAPGKLRPDDSFDGRLGTLDTWTLGGGAEDLQRRLEKECFVHLREGIRLVTLQELLDSCGAIPPALLP
jgi:hypothetical protein